MVDTRALWKAAPDRPELEALLKAATVKPMTPEQEREQRISFVLGNVGMSNPDVTRKMVEDAVDGVQPAPRVGDWIATYTGRAVYPMDLRPDDIDITDIAHSLAMQCRFNGHCIRFYSVAEHSVLVSRWLAEHYGHESALLGLLHDAAEAYLTDIPRPVKPFLQGYKQAEAKAECVIAERLGILPALPPEVKEADNRILFDEKAQNMGPCRQDWSWSMEPLGVTLQFWSPEQAKAEFLRTYWDLVESRRH